MKEYNKWLYDNSKDILDTLTIVYYLEAGATTNVTTITNTFNYYSINNNMYCPYGDVLIDTDPNNSKIKNIDLQWLNSTEIDVSTINEINSLNLNYCENMTSIRGLVPDESNASKTSNESEESDESNESTKLEKVTSLSLVKDIGLKSFVNTYVSSMTGLTTLHIGNLGLGKLPVLSNLGSLKTLGIYYNKLSGELDLTKLPNKLETINANGNNYKKVKFPEYDADNKYGKPYDWLTELSIAENKIETFYCDCNKLTTLTLPVNPLKHLYLLNIDNITSLSLQSCELRSININGLYMDKCSIIRDYFESTNKFILIHNNYLNMDEQGLNMTGTPKIYVSPQFVSNKRLSYDPSAFGKIDDAITFTASIGVISETTIDNKLIIVNRSMDFNVDFNNIDQYHEDYNDEFIRQHILRYTFDNTVLNIYNAQNLLNNPNSTLSKALKLAGDNYKLKGIKTNNPSMSNFFSSDLITLVDSPSQNPAVFSIKMVVNE